MRTSTVLPGAFLFATCVACFTGCDRTAAGPGAWYGTLRGTTRSAGTLGPGDLLDLQSGLHLDDAAFIPTIGIAGGAPRWYLNLEGWYILRDGTGTMSSSSDFGDIVLGAGDDISSDLDAAVAWLKGGWDILLLEKWAFEIGAGAGYLSVTQEVRNTTTSQSDTYKEDVVIPVLDAGIAFESDRWQIGVKAAGTDLSLDGNEARLLDIGFFVKLNSAPIPRWWVEFQQAWVFLDYLTEDGEGHFRLYGPSIAAGYSF